MKCKQCPTDFKQYSTLETLCPKCRVGKLKKDGRRNKLEQSILPVFKGYIHVGEVGRKGKTKSKNHAIANRSKTQAKKDSVIASLKAERIKKYGPYCEHCGDGEPLHYSHLIPKSIRPDLYLDPDNGCNACPTCHDSWEHLQDIDRVRNFFNLQTILSYLQMADTKRYNRVIEALK